MIPLSGQPDIFTSGTQTLLENGRSLSSTKRTSGPRSNSLGSSPEPRQHTWSKGKSLEDHQPAQDRQLGRHAGRHRTQTCCDAILLEGRIRLRPSQNRLPPIAITSPVSGTTARMQPGTRSISKSCQRSLNTPWRGCERRWLGRTGSWARSSCSTCCLGSRCRTTPGQITTAGAISRPNGRARQASQVWLQSSCNP